MTNEMQKKKRKRKKMGLLYIIKHIMGFIYTKRHFIITFIILTTFQAINTLTKNTYAKILMLFLKSTRHELSKK